MKPLGNPKIYPITYVRIKKIIKPIITNLCHHQAKLFEQRIKKDSIYFKATQFKIDFKNSKSMTFVRHC